MSFHLITITQLMQLDRPTLEYALRMFQKELEGTVAFLSESPEAAKDEATLNDLSHLLTLRKVFKLRLEEMAEEDAAQKKAAQGHELAAAA
jgi:hypothetical protein